MKTIEVLLPGALSHGFDYAVPEAMAVAPGDYVRVPFGSRETAGVVWGEGTRGGGALKSVIEHYAHLPPMAGEMRAFIDWVSWYTCSARGAVLKMALPLPEALKPPSARELPPAMPPVAAETARELSEDQLRAEAALAARLGHGFSATLLDGVTGSGKTEVYFDLIARLLEDAQAQILVLLPEISLSIQWLSRFAARFGAEPHVWHSGLTPARRKHTWRAVAQGQARVVVGARSALFLPFRRLALIVVDEEHDGSYKQEEGVIYHARDMSVARARLEKIPLLLVSATPSLETYYNVLSGRYGAQHLHLRHAGAAFPAMHMIDMRHSPLARGAFIAEPLRAALAETLARGHQSMLFLNRRGYAPLVLCRACGHRFQCPQCSAWLVLHKGGAAERMQCHHCGYALPPPAACPACHAEGSLHACGPGVERIAEEAASFLPQARLCVLASDSLESHTALQARIEAMERGEVDVLIGTQMIAKGHHFDKLALVGVVDADLGLSGGDLRAGERTYQLLHQLSGRAGREEVAGQVLLQSFDPDQPVLQALLRGDRDAFMALDLEERRCAQMPPFIRLASLIVEGAQEEATSRLARELARAAPAMEEVCVLGPAPAPLFRLRGKYRFRLLVKAERQVNLQQVIHDWLAPFKLPSSLRVKIDIDPYSFL